ncbi:energy transducer TonB [Luteimonas sp. SDU101]|uniref:energy transducer TonB n=1 Tax=unclassified Luteimonas TaxID=2629088 RepID=UPI003EBDC41D
MSDPMTHDRPASPPPGDGTPPQRSSALLWILLLLAIIAVAWYFVGRNDAPDAVPPPIGETAPMPSESPVSTAPAEREPARERTPPAAPSERPAEPIDPQRPEYPSAALRAGEEGTVVLRVDVAADGTPSDVQVVGRSGSRELDRAAERAVRDWTFRPATRDGKAVASSVQVPVDFRVERQ